METKHECACDRQHPYIAMVKDVCEKLNIKPDSEQFIEVLHSCENIYLMDLEYMSETQVNEPNPNRFGSVLMFSGIFASLVGMLMSKTNNEIEGNSTEKDEKKADKTLGKIIKKAKPIIDAIKLKVKNAETETNTDDTEVI